MIKHGQFCWQELATDDLEGAKNFYREMFGWNIKAGGGEGAVMEYSEFQLGDDYPMGGMYQMPPEMKAPPHWIGYVSVDDVDASAAKAAELGGNVVVPPMDIPKVGRFAVVADPSGAVFSMVTLTSAHITEEHGEAE
jgi:predicted enzyme related to lactoylglutathione lyase